MLPFVAHLKDETLFSRHQQRSYLNIQALLTIDFNQAPDLSDKNFLRPDLKNLKLTTLQQLIYQNILTELAYVSGLWHFAAWFHGYSTNLHHRLQHYFVSLMQVFQIISQMNPNEPMLKLIDNQLAITIKSMCQDGIFSKDNHDSLLKACLKVTKLEHKDNVFFVPITVKTKQDIFLKAQQFQNDLPEQPANQEASFDYYLCTAQLGNKEALVPLERLADELGSKQQQQLARLYGLFLNQQEKEQFWFDKSAESKKFSLEN